MPVVRKAHFERVVHRNYGSALDKLWADARKVLEHDKIRTSIEGWANKVLSRMMAEGINLALSKGSTTVEFQFSTTKYGGSLWGKYPAELRRQLPKELLVLAFELVLREAGFTVSPAEHLCVFSMPVPQPVAEDEDEGEAEVVEPEAPRSLGDALSDVDDLSDGGEEDDGVHPTAGEG